ncbi:(Na+)-NQR maturation NqrM [Colwellia sp. 4_MG-2023]|jgi:hypothetical protein|uniref:(Na+)-NQR maturation NqrM n=1 Tax=unclassified Colwellia TaxID=196834 RepID=UPI001C08D7A8|nr:MULTISPECIES: (Na+)-NQR maturation NqrM [unclassified Colwellia]MBU2923255.1 (Na+)-NQR maturation NqrM [Colwellia sp. C2M11]MDO6506727.1 (Na+)-NQR maturation NqrM [Colwellia sp. 5_MG-2023]MDO6555553.1 (Na+)-NQR maturation NqrM [Colwellia sp. 4_MG-2023]MDO6651316.1 (Na+)-NQR maturation NqrM [Colwellia sp. 3_MG-2023]MDO6664261.1 (Na+)-NQR maturation NqrM [Colwellia sp. 2_MG-2023]
MMIFIITFGFFLVVGVAMAVGYIFQNKTLAGSCGGLASVGIEKDCNCENPCEKRQARERKSALEENLNNRIDVTNL